MATYTKVSEVDAASALDGDELIEVVQGGDSLKATGDQVATFVAASTPMTDGFQALSSGIANTVQITGEYQFTEDNELDYSSSVTDGVMDSAVTFTELPNDTVAIQVLVDIADTSAVVAIRMKRSAGGTQVITIGTGFADGGVNLVLGTYWIPTENNTLYFTTNTTDSTSGFKIVGYKTGA